jgi:hypothetical protein
MPSGTRSRKSCETPAGIGSAPQDCWGCGENTTDTGVPTPWQEQVSHPLDPVLVVAWFADEPERLGQVARIDGDCFLKST